MADTHSVAEGVYILAGFCRTPSCLVNAFCHTKVEFGKTQIWPRHFLSVELGRIPGVGGHSVQKELAKSVAGFPVGISSEGVVPVCLGVQSDARPCDRIYPGCAVAVVRVVADNCFIQTGISFVIGVLGIVAGCRVCYTESVQHREAVNQFLSRPSNAIISGGLGEKVGSVPPVALALEFDETVVRPVRNKSFSIRSFKIPFTPGLADCHRAGSPRPSGGCCRGRRS